jgi:spore maturation protein CgeB
VRVLAIHPGPNFSVADVFRGWLIGLKANGIDTGAYNLDARLTFFASAHVPNADTDELEVAFTEEQAHQLALDGLCADLWKYQPDVLLIVSGFYVPPNAMQMIRDRGTKIVLLHTESPYEDDTQIARSEHADLVLINDPTNIDRFREINPNTHYQWHCYEPTRHYPGPGKTEHQSDFCFVGTGFPSRIKFLEQINWDGIDVALAGHWLNLDKDSPLHKFVAHDINVCCDNAETADLYRGARLAANLYRREAERPELATGWAMGPREVELAAIGTPFLRDRRPEGNELFPFLPTFDTPAELEELIRWHLSHPKVLTDLGQRAREAVHTRTFANSAARMMRLLNL